jgi:hypothetical protein
MSPQATDGRGLGACYVVVGGDGLESRWSARAAHAGSDGAHRQRSCRGWLGDSVVRLPGRQTPRAFRAHPRLLGLRREWRRGTHRNSDELGQLLRRLQRLSSGLRSRHAQQLSAIGETSSLAGAKLGKTNLGGGVARDRQSGCRPNMHLATALCSTVGRLLWRGLSCGSVSNVVDTVGVVNRWDRTKRPA